MAPGAGTPETPKLEMSTDPDGMLPIPMDPPSAVVYVFVKYMFTDNIAARFTPAVVIELWLKETLPLASVNSNVR